MIPIRLAVEGLYSYQQRQEVNFRPLIDSGLFGIFGQVGSGKTSLLEAISFVLYGRSERLNAKTDNRAYNMMNLRTAQMRIEFEFRAGANDQEYRYEFKTRRNSKKHHEVNPAERSVYRRDAGGVEWVPQSIEKTDIGQFTQGVLGLDYENFKRTVIIPQNQFREFLELSPTDRTQMMTQLFDLGRFDLAEPTALLDKANQTELDTLTGKLSGLESATAVAVAEAEAAVNAIKEQIQQQTDRLMVLETDQKRLTNLCDRYAKLAEARTELARLEIDKPQHDRLNQQLDQYEQTDRQFRPLLSQMEQVAQKQQKLAKQIKPITAQLNALHHQLPGLRQTNQTALEAFTNRHKLREVIDELAVMRLIWVNRQKAEQETSQLQKLKRHASRQARQIDEISAERDQRQTTADVLGRQTLQLDELREIQRWFDRDNALRESIDRIGTNLTAWETKIDALKARKNDALRGFPEAWVTCSLKNLPSVIDQAIRETKATQETSKAAHEDSQLRQKLQQFATALTDGKPCPLCGSPHHPAVQYDHDSNEATQKTGQALTEVNARLDKLTNLHGLMQALLAELRSVMDQRKGLLEEQQRANENRAAHARLFVWATGSPTDEAAVTEAIRQQTADRKQLLDLQKDIDRLTKQLEKTRLDQARIDSEVAGLSVSLNSLESSIASQLGQLTHFRPDEIAAFRLEQIDGMVNDVEKQFAETEAQYSRADHALTEAENQIIRHKTALEQLTGQQTDLQQEQDSLTADLAQALAQHGLTRAGAETILRTNLDLTAGRQQVRAFSIQLTMARTSTDNLTAELAYQPFDPADLIQTEADCLAAKTAYDIAQRQLGERTEAYAKLRHQWLEKQALQKQFDELELRRADLKELKDLFRGSGFAKYISTVRLNELCQAANDRFSQLTNNQLRLEFLDDNFVIRDFLNGGKTRLAKTLSGGQMFQAALSLALALSDNIQHLTQSKQNLFFLDEGFGTLDKAALQTVFETLKSLRRENRIVGIISHVEELQQEVETYIRTVGTGNGSRIECSWDVR